MYKSLQNFFFILSCHWYFILAIMLATVFPVLYWGITIFFALGMLLTSTLLIIYLSILLIPKFYISHFGDDPLSYKDAQFHSNCQKYIPASIIVHILLVASAAIYAGWILAIILAVTFSMRIFLIDLAKMVANKILVLQSRGQYSKG